MLCNYNDTIAVRYGINSAFVLTYIEKAMSSTDYAFDNDLWVRLPCRKITGIYPFMGMCAARNAAKRLVRANILTARQYGKRQFDFSYFYTITPYGYAILRGENVDE